MPSFPLIVIDFVSLLMYRCSFNGSYFSNWTSSAHTTIKVYNDVKYCDLKAN